MNIAVVYGQKRRGNTWALTQKFLEKIKTSDDKLTEFYLPDERIGFCTGCFSCLLRGEGACSHAEALREYTSAIDAADLLVFASPCYVRGMTGQLKTLFDHYAHRYMVHRPEASMFCKQALAVSTAAGAGMNKTVNDIAGNFFWWGVARTYKFGLRMGAFDFEEISSKRKQKIDRRVGRAAAKIKRDSGRVKAGLKTKIIFNIMRIYIKKNPGWSEADTAYWKEKGWFGKGRPYKK